MKTPRNEQIFILLVILLMVLIGLAIVVGYLQPRNPKQYLDSITQGPISVTRDPRISTAISDLLTATANASPKQTGTFTSAPTS